MERTLRWLTATALILTVFALPMELQAAGFRGAAILVTLKNGNQVRGELIAVKPDSVLLLDLFSKDVSVAVADIATANPDALIVEANPRYLSTPAAVRWMHEQDKPVIGWGLGAPPVSGFRERRRVEFLRQFDAMIAYSQRGTNEYADLGFPLDYLFVAHNSVSPSPRWKMPERTKSFKEKPCVLFVGRQQARKNVDLLLGACAEIQDVRLFIVGDGPERAELESLAKEIYPDAEFVGAKHGGELKPYFEEADLFVLPGTGGLAVQEAMSYGLPIIVAQGDGTQDDLSGIPIEQPGQQLRGITWTNTRR